MKITIIVIHIQLDIIDTGLTAKLPDEKQTVLFRT